MELTSRFQPEQIQIPIKIIMQREELQVQLGKRQTSVASEILIGHNILVPDDGFGRVQRHLVQRFELGNATFMARNLLKCAKLEKKFFFCCAKILSHQKIPQELSIQSMPIKRRLQVIWHQI